MKQRAIENEMTQNYIQNFTLFVPCTGGNQITTQGPVIACCDLHSKYCVVNKVGNVRIT
jgi:hypothetical protein